MTTLNSLAVELGITRHGAYVAAGNLVQRSAYHLVITDPSTGGITAEAERAIRAYVAAQTNRCELAGLGCPAAGRTTPPGPGRTDQANRSA
jgi:hypothetical protein